MGGAAGAHRREVEAWRARRIAGLNSPGGWRALAGLAWLREGRNVVGRDPSSDVVLPAGPPRAGVIEVAGGRATGTFEREAGVTLDRRPVGAVELVDDSSGEPTMLEVEGLRFHLIERDGALGVRIRDPALPARDPVLLLPHFPVDPRWRVGASFEPYRPPREVAVETVAHVRERYEVPGALGFEVGGVPCRLEAFREPGQRHLFLVFGDATNGVETYGGGRYMYAKPPGRDGMTVLDFNRAYNPPCVFTPYATCALPLPGNRLAVRIEAGELRYEGH